MSDTTPIPNDVLAAYETIEPTHRAALLMVRDMIFEVAGADPRIGSVDEALRWGEPAYLTSQCKSGSTIRLGIEKTSGQPALFFNCKTTLVEEFRGQFGDALRYVKNRAVLIDGDADVALRQCIASALTYHLRG